jgi:hypothetical protein
MMKVGVDRLTKMDALELREEENRTMGSMALSSLRHDWTAEAFRKIDLAVSLSRLYYLTLANVVPSNSQVGSARAESIADWVSRVQIKTSGDTVWRKATEDDWWKVKQLGFLRDALRMGVAPPARCRYRGPNWYGEENKRYRSSWQVEVGRGPKNLIVDDPAFPNWWQMLYGGRRYGRRRLT